MYCDNVCITYLQGKATSTCVYETETCIELSVDGVNYNVAHSMKL